VAVGSALVGVFLERVWPQHEAVSFGLWLVGFGVYFKFVVRHGFRLAKVIRRRGGAMMQVAD
jgi:hypothetical protein